MTDNPYANLASEGIEPAPERTSVLAILSLIIGIVSIIPLFCIFLGSGALAVLFGGAALLFIHQKRGRLSGTGLAATGIVLGLMVTVAQIVVIIIATRALQMVRQFAAEPVRASITALESGDLVGARKLFPPTTDAQITDEMLQKFSADYQAQSGTFIGFPDSIWGVIKAYAEVGPGLQAVQGRNDFIPLPGRFSKTNSMIVVIFDQSAQPSSGTLPARNIGIVTPQGQAVWLIDPSQTQPTVGPGAFQIKTGPGGVKIEGLPVPPPPAAPSAPPAEQPEKPADDPSDPPADTPDPS